MVTQIIGKQTTWSGERDVEGYRTYKIAFKILADYTDGPANVMQTPGLFLPGAPWEVDDDVDLWVWCKPDMTCKIVNQKDGEKSDLWLVEQTFTNKPFKKCSEIKIEDPLLEPMKVSGGFIKKTIEATHDRFDNQLVTSSWEQLRGGPVEFNDDHDTITIEQNVIELDLPLVESLKNNVNTLPLWGMPPRTILLTEFKWEEKYHGSCYKYYTRKFTFEINPDTWDREVPDEGTKVINGHWASRPEEGPQKRWILDNIDGIPPDPENPQHFIRFTDFNGNTAKVMLDGYGQPYNPLLESETLGCEQCPIGMSRYLEITAYPPEFEGVFKPQVIAYSSGCLWGNGSVTLEYDPNAEDGPVWLLIDLDTETIWSIDADEWDCDVTNILSQVAGGDDEMPLEVEISPTSSSPGDIEIEYYDSGDFTLLGIPLVL